MMNLDQWAHTVHQNAVDHGWWEQKDGKTIVTSREVGEILMLAVSELAEALEETRKPDFKPAEIYYMIPVEGKVVYAPGPKWIPLPNKPEGFPVELADCVIRLLDNAAAYGIELTEQVARSVREIGSWRYPTLGAALMSMTADLSKAYALVETARPEEIPSLVKLPGFAVQLSRCIARIACVADRAGFDLMDVVKLKHEFNVTRPFRHGNKRS
jgi:hypothetical protein